MSVGEVLCMSDRTRVALLLLLFLLSVGVVSVSPPLHDALKAGDGKAAAVAYLLGSALGVVVAPLSFLPALPIAVSVFGPFLAAALSVAGWSVGAIIAFWVTRVCGRPLLLKLANLSAIDRFEAYLSPRASFWWMVFFRMVVPVDIASYALGLLTRVSFFPYLAATVLGITPFAFIFSYAGSAIIRGKGTAVMVLSLIGVSVFAIALRFSRERVSERNF
jgi:uncharacterized membrane protein YdjX (TVP38/TMEM64 family)